MASSSITTTLKVRPKLAENTDDGGGGDTVKARHTTHHTRAPGGGAMTLKSPPKTPRRAVPSESWDDDFLFQHSSTSSLALPTSSTTASSTPKSRPLVATATPRRAPSTESLTSTWSEPDQEPTVTLPVTSLNTPRAPPTSTGKRKQRLVTRDGSEGDRSQTPSLSEASSSYQSHTEPESLTDGGRFDGRKKGKDVVWERDERDRFTRGASEGHETVISSSAKKKWKLGNFFHSAGSSAGRRVGEREILQTVTAPSGQVVEGQFVVLGRRSRVSSNATPALPPVPLSTSMPAHISSLTASTQPAYLSNFSATDRRTPNSSLDTNSSGYSSSSKRSSLPYSRPAHYPPPILTRSFSIPSAPPMTSTSSLDRWREYDSTTASETEGDMSELSEQEENGRRDVFERPSMVGAALSSGPWMNSQVSFASSADAFGLNTSTGAEKARDTRGKKLMKKKPSDMERDELEQKRLQRPLLGAGSPSTSSVSGASSSHSRSPTGRGSGLYQDPAMAFAQDSDEDGRKRRVSKGDVVEVDQDWLGVVPFPPSPELPREKAIEKEKEREKRTTKLVRKDSKAKSHPSVSERNREQQPQQTAKRPLSLSNILSKSTSALPGTNKRAPSPSPTTTRRPSTPSKLFGIVKSPSSNTIRHQSKAPAAPPVTPTNKDKERKVHRHSASVSDIPKTKSESSFMSRARAFSRPNSSKPITPPDVPPPSPTAVKTKASASTTSLIPQKKPSATTTSSSAPPPSLKPRLGENWKMPKRPESTVTSVSTTSNASTIKALPTFTSQTPKPGMADLLRRHSGKRPSRPPISGRPVPPRVQSNASSSTSSSSSSKRGHRPSLSLSSAIEKPDRPTPTFNKFPRDPSPQPARPRTAMAVDRPASYFFDEESIANGSTPMLERRNSLSDLKIPSRITSAQAKIEEDLQRVKEFAKGIDGLKSLRRQYQQLITIVVSPPSSPDPEMSSSPSSFSGPSPEVLQKMAQAVKRLEIDYRSWWEQAEALVDLGDGKQRVESSIRDSPGVAASRRERCVSLATTTTASPGKIPRSGSDTETEELGKSEPTRPGWGRRPSASSFETGFSVEERQKEMLRGVLAPTLKGASLPSRGPPSPRPTLGVLDTNLRSNSAPEKISPMSSKKPPLGLSLADDDIPARRGGIRRVSKAGISGIKDFLLRLKLKASEVDVDDHPSKSPLNTTSSRRSVSSPVRPATPSRTPTKTRLSNDSSEEEDWDKEMAPRLSGVSLRRSRTQSTKVGGGTGREEKMVLTTESMPGLLLKVKEVHARCEECLVRLRGVTV